MCLCLSKGLDSYHLHKTERSRERHSKRNKPESKKQLSCFLSCVGTRKKAQRQNVELEEKRKWIRTGQRRAFVG